MTHDEHTLMVHMFVRQMELINSIVEALQSRGVLQESDDLDAFQDIVRQTEKKDKKLFHEVVNQYTAFATELGLENDLP